MIVWRLLPSWLLRAWPVLALVPVGVAHALAWTHFEAHTVLVNKLVGMSLQVLGGTLILYSLDQNLGMFRKRSLLATFGQWLREFPLQRETRIVAMVGSCDSVSMSGSGTVTSRRGPSSLEERVAQLELELKEAQESLRREILALESRLNGKLSEHGSRLEATCDQLAALSANVTEVAVGNFKVQAFGVLLAVYGAITSVFA